MSNFNLDILKERNSIILFFSQSVTSISDKMLSLGLIWFITKNFGAHYVAWFLSFAFLPHLLLSFYAGRVITNIGLINILKFTTLFRGAVLFVMFFILKSWNGIEPMFIMVFLVGCGTSLFTPAVLSSPPVLVREELIALSNIIGAALSVIILNYLDIFGLILINSATFIFSFVALSFLKKEKDENITNEDPDTVHIHLTLKKYPMILRMLISFLLLNLVLTPIFVIIPWFVENVYRGDGKTLAIIEGSMGVGAFLMGVLISSFKIAVSDRNRVKMISLISLGFGILFITFSQTKSYWQGSLIMFLFGLILTYLNVQVLTYFQTESKEFDLPNIMTAVNLIGNATMPLSMAISALVLPRVDVINFSITSGVIVLILSSILPYIMEQKNGIK
jgi:hypothetical protein